MSSCSRGCVTSSTSTLRSVSQSSRAVPKRSNLGPAIAMTAGCLSPFTWMQMENSPSPNHKCETSRTEGAAAASSAACFESQIEQWSLPAASEVYFVIINLGLTFD